MGLINPLRVCLGVGFGAAPLLILSGAPGVAWLAVTVSTLTASLFIVSRRGSEEIPELVYRQDAPALRFIVQNCVGLSAPFCPPLWACSSHLQTILPAVLHRILPSPSIKFNREMVSLPDGGCLALDWVSCDADEHAQRQPVLLVLPGLVGEAMDMAGVCDLGKQHGFRCVVFNKRGHGGAPLSTPKLQSFGDPTDMRCAVLHVSKQFPDCPITAVGSSAGSGLLVSYLGEFGKDAMIAASVCISAGYDAETLFQRPIQWPYGPILLGGLKRLVRFHRRTLESVLHMARALSSRDLAEFDEHVYCRMYDIPDLKEYWRLNNPMRDVTRVQGPCLAISSLDDPICVKENIPFDLFTSPESNFILACTKRGGHCGFIESLSRTSWADQLSIDFLETALKYNPEKVTT